MNLLILIFFRIQDSLGIECIITMSEKIVILPPSNYYGFLLGKFLTIESFWKKYVIIVLTYSLNLNFLMILSLVSLQNHYILYITKIIVNKMITKMFMNEFQKHLDLQEIIFVIFCMYMHFPRERILSFNKISEESRHKHTFINLILSISTYISMTITVKI